jgi:hypothetical protein
MKTAPDRLAELAGVDARISRFNPLSRILVFDDFDEGINGWCELIGNHDGNLNHVRAPMADLRPPQLSNCTFFDIGTHGSMSGTYALKLATRPRPNHMSQVIKRLTYVSPGEVQFEAYFAFKAEQAFLESSPAWDVNADPSEARFGDFTISNDVCEGDDGLRYHCALRYVNADENGRLTRRWRYKTSVHTSTKMHLMGAGGESEDVHVQSPDDWADVPGGEMSMCYNEIPTKINWHYLRWSFDTLRRRNLELQVNDGILDLRDLEVPVYDHSYRGLRHLLNFCVDVRTRMAVRNFLFLDSVLVSVDW